MGGGEGWETGGRGTTVRDKHDKHNRCDKLTEIVSILLLDVDAFSKHFLVRGRHAP